MVKSIVRWIINVLCLCYIHQLFDFQQAVCISVKQLTIFFTDVYQYWRKSIINYVGANIARTVNHFLSCLLPFYSFLEVFKIQSYSQAYTNLYKSLFACLCSSVGFFLKHISIYSFCANFSALWIFFKRIPSDKNSAVSCDNGPHKWLYHWG